MEKLTKWGLFIGTEEQAKEFEAHMASLEKPEKEQKEAETVAEAAAPTPVPPKPVRKAPAKTPVKNTRKTTK